MEESPASSIGTSSPTCLIIRPSYENTHRDPLPRLADAVQELCAALIDSQVRVFHLPATVAGEILEALKQRQAGVGALVVYVGGHGIVHGGEHYTALADTPDDPDPVCAIWTRALVTLLAGARRDVVLLIDSCFSGKAALALDQAFAILAETPEAPRFGLVAACRAYETVGDGAFIEALLHLLRNGPSEDTTRWGPQDVAIPSGALFAELAASGVTIKRVLADGADQLRALPNLQEPDQPGRVHIKLRLRRLSAGAEAHLIDRSEGFVGRVALRERIADWLDVTSHGIFVVTGGPGTGKSALMGLLARQSAGDPQVLQSQPGPYLAQGTFDVIVHARQKTVEQVNAELAAAPSVGIASVLVDALDEAVAGESIGIAVELRSLSRRHGVRLVVGTRPSSVVRGGVAGPDPLIDELAPDDTADLDALPGTREDLEELLSALLVAPPDSPYRNVDVRDLVVALADCTTPSFLFAHGAARWLTGRPRPITETDDWRERIRQFGTDEALGTVIAEDLAGRFEGTDLDRVRDLLRAVAWAEGLGLPRYSIWPDMAEALSLTSSRYADADITWVLNEAGWYLTEAGEDGQSVYRLFHQALVDHFREETRRGR